MTDDAMIILVIFLCGILFFGDPDLYDAIINFLMRG